MRTQIRVEKLVFVQAQGFMDENKVVLAQVNSSDARTALDQAVADLTSAEEEQNRLRRTSRESRVDSLVASEKMLKHQMRAIAAAARLKADGEPKLGGIVAPPNNTGMLNLVAAANKMVTDTEPYTAVLGPVVGTDYLDKLRASITTVQQAQETGKTSRAQDTVTTTKVETAVTLGRRAIRALNPLVAAALDGQPDLLAEWNARRKKPQSRTVTPAASAGQGVVAAAPAAATAATVGTVKSGAVSAVVATAAAATPATVTAAAGTPVVASGEVKSAV